MMTSELPLFPLSTVLFPGGRLSLRIFEPRYLAMVSRCLREGHGFGIVAIDSGSEVGEARFASTGTMAEIVDWNQRRDGLLGITAEGRERFRIRSWRRQADGLYVGELEPLDPEPRIELPDEHAFVARVLGELLEELGGEHGGGERDFEDATWVGYRLAELLPLPTPLKQSMLEMTDARQRLELLRPHLAQSESAAT